MIYLLLAIASSASISILMRISEKYMKNEMAMFMSNYAVCMTMSLLFMKDVTQVGQQFMSAGFVTLGLGVLSGIMYLANFLFYKYNMKQNGIVMSATFMKLGVLVPTIMAIIVFGEELTGLRFAGITMAIIAIVIIHFEKDALSKSKHIIGLLLLLLLSGFTDSLANVFEKVGTADGKDIYLLVTFGTAFLITIFLIFFKKIKIGKKKLVALAMILVALGLLNS